MARYTTGNAVLADGTLIDFVLDRETDVAYPFDSGTASTKLFDKGFANFFMGVPSWILLAGATDVTVAE